MVNVLCSTYAGKGCSDFLSLIYLTTESGSSVVEQWARYPEVAGSIPAQIQLFKNFQISWECHCNALLKKHFTLYRPWVNPWIQIWIIPSRIIGS